MIRTQFTCFWCAYQPIANEALVTHTSVTVISPSAGSVVTTHQTAAHKIVGGDALTRFGAVIIHKYRVQLQEIK